MSETPPENEITPEEAAQVERLVMAESNVVAINSGPEQVSPLAALRAASGTNNIDALKDMANNTSFAIPHLVPTGALAMFYAKPNGGKTLFVLSQLVKQVEAKAIDPRLLFYINDDDNLSGFTTKCEIAARHGFSMISSTQTTDENLNSPTKIIAHLHKLADLDDLSGVVIVLDTLKKFVKVMSKESAPEFFHVLRKVGAKGATVIALHHANKNLSVDGDLTFSGVQDLQDDIDVQYSIKTLTDRTAAMQECLIECHKDRGPVAQALGFRYEKSSFNSYADMLASVEILDDDLLEEARKRRRMEEVVAQYENEAGFLSAHLTHGWQYLKDLLALLKDEEANPNDVAAQRLRRAVAALAKAGWLIDRKLPNERNAIQVKKPGGITRS